MCSVTVALLYYSVTVSTTIPFTVHHDKLGRRFGKNAGEWTRRGEICKEEILGSKRSMCAYILTYPGL